MRVSKVSSVLETPHGKVDIHHDQRLTTYRDATPNARDDHKRQSIVIALVFIRKEIRSGEHDGQDPWIHLQPSY